MKKTRLLSFLAAALLVAVIGCSGSNNDPVSSEGALLKGDAVDTFDGPMFAPDGPGPMHMPLMAEVLNLTDAQKEQMRAILDNHRKEVVGTRDRAAGLTREERRAKHAEAREALHAEMMAALTPEQQAKAEQLKAQLDKGEVPPELIDKHIEMLTEKLSLTPEQQKQVRELKTLEKLLAVKNAKLDREERHTKIRAAHDEARAQMMKILTPEQQETFKAMQEERRNKMREHRRRFGRDRLGRHLEHLTEVLSLNEAQQAQVKSILEEAHAAMQAKFDENGGHQRGKAGEAMQAQRQEVAAKIEAILNPEQVEIFRNLKNEHRNRRRGR